MKEKARIKHGRVNRLVVPLLSKIGHVFVKASKRKHSLDGHQIFTA